MKHHSSHAAWSYAFLIAVCIPTFAPGQTFNARRNVNSRRSLDVVNAFRDVVKLPGMSTVRIFSGDEQIALGAIVDSSGFVMTKASEMKQKLTCELRNGAKHAAKVVSVDHGTDLAILKTEVDELPAVEWNDSGSLAVGAWVATPGASDLPLAVGVISTKPHSVRGGVLGIKVRPDPLGAQVGFVIPDSGAENAGIRIHDIITHVDGKAVDGPDSLIAAIKRLIPGQKVALTVSRNTGVFKVTAVLGSGEKIAGNERASFQNQLGGPLSARRSGFASVLEHDSTLTPNQCGGPLVNLKGQVVGINIARASRVSSYAIPASIASPMVEHMIAEAKDKDKGKEPAN